MRHCPGCKRTSSVGGRIGWGRNQLEGTLVSILVLLLLYPFEVEQYLFS